MSVDTKHIDYIINLPKWKKMRDAIDGDYSIKKGGRTYLPSLLNDADFAAYSNSTNFYNATERTKQALTGIQLSNDLIFELPSAIDLNNIDNSQTSLEDFVSDVADEIYTVGRVGILSSTTLYNEETKQKATPYLSIYTAENIINWRYKDNKTAMVVLREFRTVQDTEFDIREVTYYRVLDLYEGFYRVRVFEEKIDETTNKKSFTPTQWESDGQLTDEFFPNIKGKKLTEIPFTIINSKSTGLEVQKPPLLELAETNITHYQQDTNLANVLRIVGNPTLVLIGYQPLSESDKTIKLGSSSSIMLGQGADAKFLELDGKSVSYLENYIKELNVRMSFLGARMLQGDENKTNESGVAVELKQQSEKSIIQNIGSTISYGIEKSLTQLVQFAGGGTVKFKINTDYRIVNQDPQTLQALVMMQQSGAITNETLFENLQSREIINKDENFEDYQGKLSIQEPELSVSPDVNTNTNDTKKTDSLVSVLRKSLGLNG